MTTDHLTKLGQNAAAFGKAYVALKEALMKEGVKEPEARAEARGAAAIAAIFGSADEGGGCPLCDGTGKAP